MPSAASSGIPAARQTDVFAEGQVQLGEFDVDEDASADGSRRSAPPRPHPCGLEGGGDHPRRRDDPARRRRRDRTGDRIVVIGSPRAAKAWSALLWPGGGAGPRRRALRRRPRRHRDRSRPDRPGDQRADDRGRRASRRFAPRRCCRRRASSTRPDSTRTSSSASASGRRRPGSSRCATTRRTSTRQASLESTAYRSRSRSRTTRSPSSAFDQSGIDVSINPRAVTAEEIVRFAHDPRMQQVAMLEGNRYEVLDVTTQADRAATSAWRSATCPCTAR